MHSFASLIARNSLRSRRRSVLTILSISVSFCMMGVLLSMYHLFFVSEPADQALRLVVRNKVSFAHPMPVSYMDKIKTVPGVKEVMIHQWFGGTYKDPGNADNNFARFGTDPAKLFVLHPEYSMPAQQMEQFIKRRDACIVGRGLANRLNFKIGDRLSLKGDIFPVTLGLTIAGIYESAVDDQLLYFNNDYLTESMSPKPDYAILVLVMVNDADSVTPVARRIDDMFRNSTVQTKTEPEKVFRLKFLSYLGNVKLFLFAVCASLAGTVLLVATNSIAMSVRERSQEVGVMKALGFSADTVLWMITSEAMLLGTLGGLVGLIASQVTIATMRNVPLESVSLATLSLSPGLVVLVLGLAALCGTAAALPSAWQASRRSITECLAEAD